MEVCEFEIMYTPLAEWYLRSWTVIRILDAAVRRRDCRWDQGHKTAHFRDRFRTPFTSSFIVKEVENDATLSSHFFLHIAAYAVRLTKPV